MCGCKYFVCRQFGVVGPRTYLGEAHGQEHLRAEHAAVADLCPLLEVRVVAEDLHRRLGVRVVRGLELDLCVTKKKNKRKSRLIRHTNNRRKKRLHEEPPRSGGKTYWK